MNSIATPNQAMAALAAIRMAVTETSDIDQVRTFRDQAEALRHYVKSAAMSLSLQNRAAEVKLVAERRIGELLSGCCSRGGDRKSAHRDVESDLKTLGLNRSQSARYQLEAAVPEDDFVQFVEETNATGRELTSNALIRLARLHAQVAKPPVDKKNPFARLILGLQSLARQQKYFTCVYADPPWSRGTSRAEVARLPKRLCDLPVKAVMAKNAHAHLWVPPDHLESGLAILRAWGFRYKDCLVRGKIPEGYGQYWRHAHDVLLLGVRGRLCFRDTDLSSRLDWQDMSSRESSEIYSLIGRASSPPFLDLFAVNAARGWTVPRP
jgi:N6-adenosine-specific RNA methylase IME4